MPGSVFYEDDLNDLMCHMPVPELPRKQIILGVRKRITVRAAARVVESGRELTTANLAKEVDVVLRELAEELA